MRVGRWGVTGLLVAAVALFAVGWCVPKGYSYGAPPGRYAPAPGFKMVYRQKPDTPAVHPVPARRTRLEQTWVSRNPQWRHTDTHRRPGLETVRRTPPKRC